MVREGEQAPDFSLPMAGGDAYNDVRPFVLTEALEDGPVVLAFVPAAFTSGCSEEMCTFRDSIRDFAKFNAQVLGVSVDLPFAQNIWIQELDLNFPMLSDWNHEVIREYDVVYQDMYDMIEVAERSVFVIDTDGTVVYEWVREEGNPDFEVFIDGVSDVVSQTVGEP